MSQKMVIKEFPAGAPRGSWPAEEFVAGLRAQGMNAEIVMDLSADAFLVVDVTDTSADLWV
ncbi:hypothetical protein [Streptomyces sp. NPDC049916]|uniref:hypothetical protein n=1 Tax=Streptomyces sp. NPDC049916 TaxID=3155156 RepID=UPI00343CCA43